MSCTEILPGDILISRLPDPVGRACIIPQLQTKMITAVDCTIIRFNKTKLLPEYFLFISKSKNYFNEITKYLTGASRQRISRTNLAKVKIPLPPIETQEQIVAELESYQKVIDGAQAVVENWKPNVEIDPKWKIEKLANVSKMIRGPFGGSLKKEIFKPTGYLVYEQYHAINDDFNFGRYFINEAKFEEMKRFKVFAGDILVSCSGTMGKIAIVPDDYKKGIINQALLKLTPNKQKILGQYLKHALESESIQQKHFRNQNGVAIPNVASVKVLSQIEIPLPPIETQEQIVAKIEEEQKIVEANKKLIDIFQQKIDVKIKSIYKS